MATWQSEQQQRNRLEQREKGIDTFFLPLAFEVKAMVYQIRKSI